MGAGSSRWATKRRTVAGVKVHENARRSFAGLDRRLGEARSLIEAGSVSVLSLDVFDTLLWRTVPRPTDAFLLFGHQLAEQQRLNPTVDPDSFRRLRIEAEGRAREERRAAGRGTEVFLEDIWRQVGSNVVDGDPEWLSHEETELERRITFPDLDILALATHARASGCEIALVSNTYFSSRRILRLLDRPELLDLGGVRVFPSCELGVHKGEGMFKLVLDGLDVRATRVLHVGDDLHSDVEPAKKEGIRFVYFPRFSSEFRQILDAEGALPPDPSGPSPIVVDAKRGDHGLTALRAKVLERTTRSPLPESAEPEWQFGATVLGPILTGFAEWVHREANRAGVDTVWCMQREGELLADLVNEAADYLRSPVTGRPIWLSRHMTNRATLSRADKSELGQLLHRRRLLPTVSEFMTSLGLDIGEVPELRSSADACLDDPGLTDSVLETLAESSHLRGRILAEAEGARRRLVRYLEQTMGGFPDRLVLVDLGWGGTIQRYLDTALSAAGIVTRVTGLYLLTNHVALGRILGGSEMAGYLAHCGEPASAVAQIARSPEVVEQACLATEGSLLDFDEDSRPILDDSVPLPDQVISKLGVQHGVRVFQQEWARYARGTTNWMALEGRERPLLLEIFRRSVVRPTRQEAVTFGSWYHEDNFGTAHREHIVPRRLASFVPYLSPSDLLEMTMNDAFWPLGLAAQHDPALAAATIALLEGSVPPETFRGSRKSGVMKMWVDCGNGFERPLQRDLMINSNGLSYGHFTLEGRGINAVRFDPCDHPALIRLDWIDMSLKVVGSTEVVPVHLSSAADFAGLTYGHCRWVYDGVVFSGAGYPEVLIPLAHRAPGEIYAVDFHVAFSVIRLPPSAGPFSLDVAGYQSRLRRAVAKARAEYAAGGAMSVVRGARRVVARRVQHLEG